MNKWLLLCLIPLAARAGDALKVVRDQDVFKSLPGRYEVENIDDRLFRSLDGRELHFGPDPQSRFYVVTGATEARELKAPSTGKAYLNAKGEFVIWYDRLDQGVHFPQGFTKTIEKPAETRFGVSYGAGFFYTATSARTEVYATDRPFKPLLRLEGIHAIKVVPHEDDKLYVFAYERFAGQNTRSHLCLLYQEVNGAWTEMKRHPLPDYLTLLDFDPAAGKVLLVDNGPSVPALYELGLRRNQLSALGPVDEFGLYLHPDFKTPEP